jgi:hypothetical protein
VTLAQDNAALPAFQRVVIDEHPPHMPYYKMVGDLNGDGRADIVVTPSKLKGERYRISWFEAAADPARRWTEHIIVPDIECVIHALALGDFNHDGALDIAYAEMHQGSDPDEVIVLFNFDRGTRWEKQVLDTNGSHDIRAADVDGDGDLDLVGANHADVFPVVIWENQLVVKSRSDCVARPGSTRSVFACIPARKRNVSAGRLKCRSAVPVLTRWTLDD